MQWWDIYVQVPETVSESVSACLHHLGSSAVVFHEGAVLAPEQETGLDTARHAPGWVVVQGAFPGEAGLPAQVEAVQRVLSTATEEATGMRWRLYCRLLPDHDYLTRWQRFFAPFVVENRLLVCPPWDRSPVAPGLVRLTLDPGLAFGTGAHPSTHLCLTLLTRLMAAEHRLATLLDVGCGSGILALAALRLGVRTAIGVDIDAQAVAVAVQNAALNALQEQAQFLHGSVEVVSGRFALVTANIYLRPLLEMMPALTARLDPGGTCILSGILEAQETTLRLGLQEAGLEVGWRLAAEGWVAIGARHVGGVSMADHQP